MSLATFAATLAERVERAARHRDATMILGTGAAYAAAVLLAVSLTRNSTNVAAIWPANGFLLAALLSCPRRRSRHAMVALCLAANVAANLVNGDPLATVLTFSGWGVVECVIAFHLLRLVCGRRVELTEVGPVLKFVAIGFAAPILPALVGGLAASALYAVPYLDAVRTWYLSDSLGLLIVTPTILLAARPTSAATAPAPEVVAGHFALLVIALIGVFTQSTAPLLFLIVPISVLIAFRLGARYAAAATVCITVVSLTSTYLGVGPAILLAERETGVWVIQLFCLINLLTSLAVAAEIAERDRLKHELERVSKIALERRFQLDVALNSMSQGVCVFDAESRVVVRNTRFLAVYGLPANTVVPGMSFAEMTRVCRAAGVVPGQLAPTKLNVDADIDQQLVDGRHIRISQRRIADGGVICTYTDFTAEKRIESELLHRTLHDVLTGLPNRRLLVERMEQALAAARRGRHVAVMLLDVDHFKSVNDSYGHAAGDELLKIIADRLRAAVRETDTVARLGGDEFAILLLDDEHDSDTATVANRILDATRQPIFIGDRQVRSGVSIGIARPPAHGKTTDDILKSADVALYKAKRNGRGGYEFYDATEDAGATSERRLEGELRRALEDGEFRLVYQPVVAGHSGRIAALEALIRWDHPQLGTIPPADFIPLAERNGLISDIGDWVLERACRDAARLPPEIRISVNLSRVQVSDQSFAKRVARILQASGVSPARIELEVAETAIIDNEVNAYRVLSELGTLGVSVAIDDFGVGQSALRCLRDMPIGRIKIDRSFVNDLANDPKARSIFVAVASLARSLGIKTTAEGIETEQQGTIASLAGCDHLQGYLLGRPMALEDLDFGFDVHASAVHTAR